MNKIFSLYWTHNVNHWILSEIEMMTFIIDINILMIARNISFDKQNLLSTTN